MILVFGGSGTVGRELVRLLSSSQLSFRVFTRHPQTTSTLYPFPIPCITGDLGDATSVEAAVRGASRIFLLIPSDPRQVAWENRIIDAARGSKVEHIVRISTLGAKVDGQTATARWHGQCEELLRKSDRGCTILRCHNFMQNTFRFIAGIQSEGVFQAPLEDATLALVDARDIAEVAFKALTEEGHAGKIYRLTGGGAISYAEVASILSEVSGRQVRYQSITDLDAWVLLKRADVPDWQIDDLIALYRRFRDGNGSRVWQDVEHLLGRPARTFREFVEDHREVFSGDAPMKDKSPL